MADAIVNAGIARPYALFAAKLYQAMSELNYDIEELPVTLEFAERHHPEILDRTILEIKSWLEMHYG